MEIHFSEIFTPLLALAAGGFIGYSFGLIQNAARARNEKLQADGQFNSAWAAMPGSGRRVAYLLVVLALIQFGCPLLFRGGTEWWVSGGVVAGYGAVLLRQLRLRLAQRV